MFLEETRPYLHGEIVGIGLLLQNYFNGDDENNAFLLSLAKKHNMPHSLSGIGLHPNEATKAIFFTQLSASSAIDAQNAAEKIKLADSLDLLFDRK